VVAIASAISPYRETRNQVRHDIGAFVLVYVKCSLEVLIQRDAKGLYKKALSGEIPNFTGISDPYEPPLDADVTVDTDVESPSQSIAKIIAKLDELQLIGGSEGQAVYSTQEEAEVEGRLRALGYLP
jgi:adenylylsulfate kinase